MSEHIRVVIEYSVKEGRFDDFKRLANELVEKTEANDAKMLVYEWYISEDGNKCFLVQTLTGSEAILAHLGNVGDILGRLNETVQIEVFRVYGNPSEAVRQAYGQFAPQYFEYLRGFIRG